MVRNFLLAVLLVFALPALGNVTATLSRTEISEYETVQLSIRLEGIAPRDRPDFSALNKDFDILHITESSTTRIVNNTLTAVAEWILFLRPKRVAKLTIPALEIANHTTKELSLIVEPMSDELRETLAKEVFWETSVDRQEQYVHGSIHVERKLYYSDSVTLRGIGRRGLPAPQDIENAHIVNLSAEGRNWIQRYDRSYSVLSREFVIFAEKSGTLTLPEASVVASINVDNRTVSMIVQANSEDIKILPRPKEYPADAPWLPATNVFITDDLGNLNLSNLVVGDSFSRRTTIEALEGYSTGIPNLEVELPEGIRTYPVNPEFKNDVLVNKIIGTRTDEQAFVVTQEGEYQIPDAELVWWNTDTNQVERTVVPGRTFSVRADPLATTSIINEFDSNGTSMLPNDAGVEGTFVLNRPIFTWILILALVGWSVSLVFAGMWVRDRRNAQKNTTKTSDDDVKLDSLLKSDVNREVKEGMVCWLTSHLAISRVRAIELLQQDRTTAAILRSINAHHYGTSGMPAKLDRSQIKRALQKIVEQYQQNMSNTSTYWQFYQPV